MIYGSGWRFWPVCHFCRMNYRVLLVVVLSGAFFSLGWCQELDQKLDFEALKMEAFRTPDSVHAVVLEVYDDAWVEGRGGLHEWAYLLGLTDYLQSLV